jgi:TolA-binding protein
MSLGEHAEAIRLAESLPESDRARRLDLMRTMVDRALTARPPAYARAMDLVTAIAADPALGPADRLWALTRQAEMLISTGYPGDAVSKIVRTLPRLEVPAGPEMGELLVTLGKAYIAEANHADRSEDAADRMAEARKQLMRAQTLMGPEHPLQWLSTLLLAEIDQHDGELEQARARYAEVVENYQFADGRPVALLGLAEVLAQISNQGVQDVGDDSLQRYIELVEVISTGQASAGPGKDRVGESLLARFREQYEKGRYAPALQFASLAEKLYGPDETPVSLLLGIAETHKRLAEELLRDASGRGILSLVEANPATQREARDRLLRAGDYYRRHAGRVVIADAPAYAQSLWDAADAFDRAGDLEASITAFRQFTTDFPGDERRPEATFRLAQAYQARGDAELAGRLYQELIDSRGSVRGAGPFADMSYVPLAHTMLADADAGNDERAEALLMQVISGEVSGPTTTIFRDALREFGDHYARTRQYPAAIERFEQYLAMSAQAGGSAGDVPVKYRLADAYRLSAAEIGRTLRTGLPDGLRRDLSEQRSRRLERAGALYEDVRAALDARTARTGLEDLLLRNSYFYAADCEYDLGDYESAIRRYELARERYSKEPAALVAMTQVVSALLAQGQGAKAQAAHRRALRFYESMPESVWDDPSLPMTREGWARWLDAQSQLAAAGTSAGGPGIE